MQREASSDVISHFTRRAPTYDRSSAWCTDDALLEMIVRAACVDRASQVLDVACGTGLVARRFAGRVARVVGLDLTTEMAAQARDAVDTLVTARAEAMPFPAASFDAVVCRQGIQFMALPDAVHEMVRVTRPGGRIVLVNLCAYGPEDRAEYFEILRLRNPARRHFFLPQDLHDLLSTVGCRDIELARHVTIEDIDTWSGHGAIEEARREDIRRAYRNASPGFRSLHAAREADGRLIDHMLFVVASGVRS